jgi:CarD family transcriptional regulator
MFKVGERVVHPQYGVGHVVKLDEREFEPGVTRRYYEISIPGGSTVWVPVDLATSGLRKLTAKSELARCRQILSATPAPLTEDARLRQSDLSARLRQGTIVAQCEVVRDLSAHGAHKPISGTIAGFLQSTQNVLCQEWAIVEGVTLGEAAAEVESLLEKGRLTLGETEA